MLLGHRVCTACYAGLGSTRSCRALRHTCLLPSLPPLPLLLLMRPAVPQSPGALLEVLVPFVGEALSAAPPALTPTGHAAPASPGAGFLV